MAAGCEDHYHEMGKTFQKVTSGDVGSKPECSNTIDPDMERFYRSGSTASTGRLVNMHAAEHGYSILYLDAENAYVRAEEDEEVYCWPPKRMGQEISRQRWTCGKTSVETERSSCTGEGNLRRSSMSSS